MSPAEWFALLWIKLSILFQHCNCSGREYEEKARIPEAIMVYHPAEEWEAPPRPVTRRSGRYSRSSRDYDL